MFISFKLPLAGAAVLSVFLPLQANAAMFSKVYTFGDSLSDVGRLYALTGNAFPVSPPYDAGRASNGPLWIEYLQNSLGITPNPADNFALNSATTGSTNTAPIPGLYGLQQQIDSFPAGADPNALYVIWAGANDYLGGGVTDPTIPVTNLTNSIVNLYGKGAKNFLVVNLPDLGKTPLGLNSPASTALSSLSSAHDQLLKASLNNLSQTLPGVDINPLDVFSLFNNVASNPGQYGLTNVTDACLPTNPIGVPSGLPCSNPDQYFFWDALHPSTRAHQIISAAAQRSLGVPEPSTVVALVSVGLLGAGVRLKQKTKV
ncbi:MAG: Phosphatidylcholine-sterol acyltransferase [Chroococcopsis gigantea SAG 12.99]|jgi:phospholipase/lecithinase/hemolysin|nr:SGNH/GDSL hydrolase family protein [Chlorogloea purpurea SAG 13.99]MDV3000946.1 Phosphatidylcholine-sterol acyltransferase [Chroococcopsis gigantea SAG 12.99]